MDKTSTGRILLDLFVMLLLPLYGFLLLGSFMQEFPVYWLAGAVILISIGLISYHLARWTNLAEKATMRKLLHIGLAIGGLVFLVIFGLFIGSLFYRYYLYLQGVGFHVEGFLSILPNLFSIVAARLCLLEFRRLTSFE